MTLYNKSPGYDSNPGSFSLINTITLAWPQNLSHSFKPFVSSGDKDVIRVGGRVDKAIVSYDTKNHLYLPIDHWMSWLITR